MGWSSGDDQPLTDEEISEYFKNNENNFKTSFGLPIERKQQLFEALSGWSCPNSQHSAMSHNTVERESNSAGLIFENNYLTCDTDSDLSSLEDD